MDIEKLIKEQKKTQEIFLRLEKAGTFRKFFDEIPTENFDFHDNPMGSVDPWNYKELSEQRSSVIAESTRAMYDAISKIKYCLGYIDELYGHRIAQLTKEKYFLRKGPQERHKIYEKHYANPMCQAFFESYESEHENVTPLETLLETGGGRGVSGYHHMKGKAQQHQKEYRKEYYIKNRKRINERRAKKKEMNRRAKAKKQCRGIYPSATGIVKEMPKEQS